MHSYNFQLRSMQNPWKPFVNELLSIKKCFASHCAQRKIEKNNAINTAETRKKSNALQLEANLIMSNSSADVGHAARLYTEAIIAAPKGSEELAFAHANRSLALMRLGYLESAYDDCLCALDECYPIDMRYKLILRQAELAKELGEVVKMKQHISELKAMKLETSTAKKVQQLTLSLYEMQANVVEKRRFTEGGTQKKSFEEPFKIVEAVGQKQRSMIATKPIKKGDTIFIDRAFAFVCKTPGAQVCNNCADTMIVPFPCVSCSGKVVYCSLKCKKNHAKVHVYECSYIEKCVADDMIQCLPLRILLEGLPEILPYLNKKRDAQSLWTECFQNKEMKKLKYIRVLHAISCSKNGKQSFLDCLAITEHLVIHLKNYTNFFESFAKTAASIMEWQIFIGALYLRHLGHILISRTSDRWIFNIELNRLTSQVKRGQLFSMLKNTCEINSFFPSLFIWNHQCTPMFERQSDGMNMRAVATINVKLGDEINDCYLDWSRGILNSKLERRLFLMEHYCFICACDECVGPDKVFTEFHQFWCENPECRKSYSPEYAIKVNGGLICSYCLKTQDFNYKEEKECIIILSQSARGRVAMFYRFDNMKRKFKDYNFTKLVIMQCLTAACINSHFAHEPLMSSEFDKLHEINVSMLEYPIEILEKRHQYLLIFLSWDVIALRGKKIHVNELENSIKIVNNIETKEHSFVMKYYEDFIVPLIK